MVNEFCFLILLLHLQLFLAWFMKNPGGFRLNWKQTNTFKR